MCFQRTYAGPIIPITSQRIGITIAPFGTISDDLVVCLQAQINGSSYMNVIDPAGNPLQWTGAQIKATTGGASAGIYQVVDVKATTECHQVRNDYRGDGR